MRTLRVIGPALLTLLFAASAVAQQNTCGNAATTPSIVTTSIVDPPALDSAGNATGTWYPQTGRLETQGIEYISGDVLRLQVLTDGCTDIQSVQVGSTVLTPSIDAPTGTALYSYYYWFHSIDTQNNLSGHGYLMWIGWPTLTNGKTEQIVVTFVRSGGTGTAKYSFPIVHVGLVQPTNSDSPVGISNTEIHNIFATALNHEFSGPDGSVVVNGTKLYGYDPSSLGTYIDSIGIWFAFKFKADIACKPTIRVNGTFALVTNAPGHLGLSVQWVNPAAANPDIGWCEVGEQLLGDITDGLLGYSGPVANVQQLMTQQIMNALPNTSQFNLFLDGTTTQWDELQINLKLPAPSIEIDSPYSAFDMTPTPAPFPPGQLVGILATGLGMYDYDVGATPRTLIPSCPNGVPLHTPQSLSNAFTVQRTGALVDANASVAQLLARFPAGIVSNGSIETSDFEYKPGCSLTIPKDSHVASPAILFGVNDTTADAQRLRASGVSQGYKVYVAFGFAGSPCTLYTRTETNR